MEVIMALSLTVIAYFLFEKVLKSALEGRLRVVKRLDETERLEHLQDEGEKEKSRGVVEQVMDIATIRMISAFEVLIPDNPEASKKVEEKLLFAGMHITPKRYRATVVFRMFMAGVILFVLTIATGYALNDALMYMFFGIAAGYVLSRFDLGKKVTKRQEEIYHQLPNAMDLLSVSVAAGLGFDQAIDYLVEKSEGALIDEFAVTQRELMLGRNRKEAMKDLANRCNNLEMQAFVTAVLQAAETGSSLKNVLQTQAASIREAHKQAVEEKAYKLAVKMLIPMVLFIFPVIFIVLMGPAVLQVIDTFASM